MALHEVLVSLAQGNNAILFLILIVLFIVGYKVLQVVVNTALVAIFSGALLVAMGYLGIGPAVTVNRVILFMVLGTALFIGYSLLATFIRTTSSIIEAFQKLAGWLSGAVGGGEEETKEREIVLEELDDDG